MNYIVFDLEWNQCPYGKYREEARLPFEIIEIGAVKLNKNRERVEEFHRIVKPSVYKKLHYRTREVVNLDEEALAQGIGFEEAAREFLAFCGPEAVFCTWGNIDLLELQRNMKYYGILSLLKGPLHFCDVQKMFSIFFEDGKSRKSLEHSIEFLQLEKDQQFHSALADARYTARIFMRIGEQVIRDFDSIDCYQNPKSKKEEIHAVYKGYSKFISREFSSKEEAISDREIASTHCNLCGKTARKKLRWFSGNSKNYYCLALCPQHGLLKGKARMKKTDEGKIFVIKTIRQVSDAEAAEIRQKKEMMRKKRRMKK